jgi:citrate synthase
VVNGGGLDEVVAAETILSEVDGRAGRLVIRGRSLDELAGRSRFEDVLALLWSGLVPPASSLEPLSRELGRARQVVFEHLRTVDGPLLEMSPIEAVRALLARIRDGDDRDTALALAAAPAVLTAGVLRLRRGLAPIAPEPQYAHAADFLRMTSGGAPSAEQIAALDAYLVTVSDHGLNASTFAARVVASTRAGLTSAALAALGALKGPLHGGAPGPVLDMLDEIGKAECAPAWLEDALARGERLMGFGHRVYRVRDPRADALKGALGLLARAGQVDAERLRLAEAVECAALEILVRRKPDRRLETNVEFYTALLLESLGVPREAFTCVFAAGRIAGWIAHAREQALHGRLIRPLSRYVGPSPSEAKTA